jgi:hypothetical protein
LLFARRAHLYLGLFLLPWVLLYGITGPMFSHKGLFSEADLQSMKIGDLKLPIADFPELDRLAETIVGQVQASVPGKKIVIDTTHKPSLTGGILYEMDGDNSRIVVEIDPINELATIERHPLNTEKPNKLLPGIHDVVLPDAPLDLATQSVKPILEMAKIADARNIRDFGWTKINFLASVDGTPARFTYVLNDNHLDVTEYKGEDGMTGRELLMRLHTTHGYPISWNARRIWILFSDLMGIAMVSWAITGLLMWWQIKRTRLFGAVVIACSLVVAMLLYWGIHHFYATNLL